MSDLLPLFPLPNVVLFPNVFLPLHIFEPRYREMVADALASDRLIGMVLLKPGWEHEYEGRPPVYPIGCSGVITHVDQLPMAATTSSCVGLNASGLWKRISDGPTVLPASSRSPNARSRPRTAESFDGSARSWRCCWRRLSSAILEKRTSVRGSLEGEMR